MKEFLAEYARKREDWDLGESSSGSSGGFEWPC